eukprot:scaffold122044_cov35-Phaeocystis_antarctica.AAC.3
MPMELARTHGKQAREREGAVNKQGAEQATSSAQRGQGAPPAKSAAKPRRAFLPQPRVKSRSKVKLKQTRTDWPLAEFAHELYFTYSAPTIPARRSSSAPKVPPATSYTFRLFSLTVLIYPQSTPA